MTKNIITLGGFSILLLLFPNSLFSQNENKKNDYIWQIGYNHEGNIEYDGVMLDFHTDPVTIRKERRLAEFDNSSCDLY